MEDLRPGKRTSRACEPCRRKKVKCSGERPMCSFCRRLGQDCDYRCTDADFAQSSQNPGLENRMEAIEEKLDELLRINRSNTVTRSEDTYSASTDPLAASHSVPEVPSGHLALTGAHSTTLPSSGPSLEKAGELYQKWCHNQPLYLFRQEGFLDSLRYRDKEICLAIQALGSRFPPGNLTIEKRRSLDIVVESCRRLVTARIVSGSVKLSTLQSLCLLSLISFGDGNVMQAGLDLTMANYFASGLPTGSSLGDPLECSLCVQGISLLRYIQEKVVGGSKAGDTGSPSRNPTSMNSGFNWHSMFPLFTEPGRDLDPGLGILPYVAQAAEAWQMARSYAASPVTSNERPPWDSQSDYSLIMLRLLEIDSVFPLKYRFARANFSELNLEDLQRRRAYWGPWFFIQFVHSTIPTLVNHPFLLSMRLKNFRRLMPQTFIHQSFDQIARHTGWIICFIDLVEKQQFQLSDPIIAHCVAIVATIHLQHSFVPDTILREKAQNGYEKCIAYLNKMSAIWPIASSMSQNLRDLRNSVTTAPPATTQDQQITASDSSWSIDAQLLWDILIYEKAGRQNAVADRSMFGEAVTFETQHRGQDMTEFAMVGSAGISGHKTVPREVSAYPPKNNEPHGSVTSSIMIGEEWESCLDQVAQFQDLNQMMDQQDNLLQPEDFGKTFNNWFNLDFN